MLYREINETAARRAKEMNSFSDYVPGSATAGYRASVDKAVEIATAQKEIADPMYHERIDYLLDLYAKKLADNINAGYQIETRCPSILISGGSNFPVRKKEKQNAARDRNMTEWNKIQGLLDKIRSTGMGGISADNPDAVQKLRDKLAALERGQAVMKAVNAYYRKNGTLEGCPDLDEAALLEVSGVMSRSWRQNPKPFESWALSNNNANIKRVRDRIATLEKQQQAPATGWEFDGGRVEMNTGENRIQIIFDGKPDDETRGKLKGRGFRWAPSQGAWQRQLTDNAIYAARSILPVSGGATS